VQLAAGIRRPGRSIQGDAGLRLAIAARSGLVRSTESIVSGDYKEYDSVGLRFGVAQVEVTDMLEIEPRLDELRAALCQMEKNRELSFAALMVTDIVGGTSRLLTCVESHHLDGLPYARRPDGTFEMPGIVSRKKQLIPVILSALQA
jgi:manganese-dependent inorganic pyrophosphatase